MKILWRKFLCKILGHDWNYNALIDTQTGSFEPACNRCFITWSEAILRKEK